MILDLSGPQGNAFSVMGTVADYLRRSGQSGRLDAFTADATSGDYDHLLDVCQAYCPALAYRHRPARDEGASDD